jgi:hypothetical protein
VPRQHHKQNTTATYHICSGEQQAAPLEIEPRSVALMFGLFEPKTEEVS